jgi:hypothetical protein
MKDLKQIQEFFSKPLNEEKEPLDIIDLAKVVKAVQQTGHPVTVLLVPKFNEIEVITGMNAPDDMLRDLSIAVDSLGYGRNDIIIAGDSSNLSRREYSDIRRVNGGAKDYFEEAIAENDSYARVSKPRFIKDKNNPNFLNVILDYDIGPGGNSIAFGKETMSGQIRRLSSEKARKIAHDIALDLEANFNLEDIEVTDLKNGKVRIFAVSDDFIDMDPNMLSEASKDEETEFHKKLDTLVHDTFGKRKGEMEEVKGVPVEKTPSTITRKEWDKTPKNGKAIINGIAYVERYDRVIGTYMAPIKIVDEIEETELTEVTLKKGDIVNFADGKKFYIIGPKGDGYEFTTDNNQRSFQLKKWFDMMISKGEATLESVKEAKMPEPRKDEYYFLVRNSDAKDVWKMADYEFGNDIDRGRIEVLFQKNKYVIKDFELAKRFYQYLRDRGVKFFDQNFVSESVEVTESYVPSNIAEFAKRRGVSSLVRKVAGWAEKVGARITGGTAIGKGYNTLILDMGYQTADIRIDVEDETIELYDEPIYSFNDFKRVFMEEESRKQAEHDEETLRREQGLEEKSLNEKMLVPTDKIDRMARDIAAKYFSSKTDKKDAIEILKQAIKDSYKAMDPEVEIREEEGYSQFLKDDPEHPGGKTKGLTPDVMNKILMRVVQDIEESRPGLWDNIRAKRERGEKPSRKGSKAYKSAVKAGKEINKAKD